MAPFSTIPRMARRANTAASADADALRLDDSTRILVLVGAEEMLMRQHLDRLRAALAQTHGGPIDSTLLDGKTAQLAEVLDELRTLSLLQPFKLVVVDQAEEFVKRYREALVRYAQQPCPQAALVLRARQWHKGNLDKHIAQVGVIVRCDPLNAAAARAWAVRRAREVHARKLETEAAALLIERLGTELMRLDSELGKLSVLADDREGIRVTLVQQVVGRSGDEEAWAVQEAVLKAIAGREKNAASTAGAMIQRVHDLLDLSDQPRELIVYFVADLFRKLMLAKAMKGRGASVKEIEGQLRLWGPRTQLVMQALEQLGRTPPSELFDRIVRADRQAKSGLGDHTTNLECFLATMTDAR